MTGQELHAHRRKAHPRPSGGRTMKAINSMAKYCVANFFFVANDSLQFHIKSLTNHSATPIFFCDSDLYLSHRKFFESIFNEMLADRGSYAFPLILRPNPIANLDPLQLQVNFIEPGHANNSPLYLIPQCIVSPASNAFTD